MAKSLLVSYILWLCGPLGLHHFYLGRDKQLFVWWSTFGGFILGWMRDFFRLPSYVHESNPDDGNGPVPPQPAVQPAQLRWERCIGAIILGSFYGLLLRVLIPEDLVTHYSFLGVAAKILAPLGVSIGVYLVCNIGREVSSFSSAAKGAYIIMPITLITEDSYLFYMAIAAVISVRWHGVDYITSRRPRPSVKRRCLTLSAGMTSYVAIWTVILLFNVRVTTETGESVPLRTVTYNFFHSEAWRETRSTGWYLYEFWMKHGWEDMGNEMKRKFDTSGLGHAREVLGVTISDSEEHMREQYRRLAKKWHPDKYQDPDEREYAQERFIEIQSAWEKISAVKARRDMRNRQSRREEL